MSSRSQLKEFTRNAVARATGSLRSGPNRGGRGGEGRPRRGRGGRRGGGGRGGRRGGRGRGRGGRGRGGRGKGRFGHRSAGSCAPFSVRETRDQDEIISMILHPKARPVIPVPNSFATLGDYCDIVANNILAEYWYAYRSSYQGQRVIVRFRALDNKTLSVRASDLPDGGVSQSLVEMEGIGLRIIQSQKIASEEEVILTMGTTLPAGYRSGSFRYLLYVGGYVAEFRAAVELATKKVRRSPLIDMILNPCLKLPGDYANVPMDAKVPCNPSQTKAVKSINLAVETIQGPPGTGKSTTVYHLVRSRIPSDQRILVTCSRNVAVDSLAKKLADVGTCVVVGNVDRVGSVAGAYLVQSKIDRDPQYCRMQTFF